MEAKYISLTEAAKEDNWLKELVNDVGLHQKKTVVFCASQSVIYLSKDQSFMTR